MVYVSGQVPVGPNGQIVEGGIEAQTRQVLENIKAALALAGAAMEDVVKPRSGWKMRAISVA